MSKGSIAGTTTADQQKQIAMAMQQAAQQYVLCQAAMQQNAYAGQFQGITVVDPGHTHQIIPAMYGMQPATSAYPAGYIIPATTSGAPSALQGLYYPGIDAVVTVNTKRNNLLEPEFDLDEIERAQDLIDELT